MKLFAILLSIVLPLTFSCGPLLAADTGSAAFEKMRQLAGSWTGKDDEGQPATVKYETMSGGSIVTETLKPDNEEPMLTVYHLDGDHLMCTHYCSRNNQPRMRLDKYDSQAGTLDFDFLDATNLPDREQGHMHHLILKLQDKDHLTQEWSWHEAGQESQAIFHFQRDESNRNRQASSAGSPARI